MKGERPVSTERPDDAESIAAPNAVLTQEDGNATIQGPDHRVWYQYLNEDWLATLVGLLLVILIVVGLLHSIP
jgi:uncharacterized integral membrane protein